ncbi:hypothetical protein [Streptomyces sp. AC495_CC817]|uniref:hypothetical protein n=1 Tax=Streptomyces sp. AC495_CC817 TaxID=2823900 RepID=UPI001C278882|nr:hypothetical protein [Streptomyces sp. AC495_CC817]
MDDLSLISGMLTLTIAPIIVVLGICALFALVFAFHVAIRLGIDLVFAKVSRWRAESASVRHAPGLEHTQDQASRRATPVE